MASFDVIGDGNCFYKAVSIIVYGDQKNYVDLRQSLAQFVSLPCQSACISSANNESLRQLANDIRKDESWAGKDIILATANFLQGPLHVYCASCTSPPLVYAPELSSASQAVPVLLVFYEPGHFGAIFNKSDGLVNGTKPVGNGNSPAILQ